MTLLGTLGAVLPSVAIIAHCCVGVPFFVSVSIRRAPQGHYSLVCKSVTPKARQLLSFRGHCFCEKPSRAAAITLKI